MILNKAFSNTSGEPLGGEFESNYLQSPFFFVCTTLIDLAAKVFDRAIQHLEDAQKANAALIDSNPDVLSIYGSCLHSKARLVDNQSQGDDNPAKAYVEKAIELLVKAEELQDEDGDAKTLEAVRRPITFEVYVFVDSCDGV